MNIDQRLYRAAHDLRELDIDVPPLDVGSATGPGPLRRRLGAPVATVMLLAVGALGAVAELTPGARSGEQVATQVEQPVAATRESDVDPVRTLSAREEIAMIAALNRSSGHDVVGRDVGGSVPPGVS